MTRRAATFIGFGAVLLWSLLALFTVGSAPVPPLLLNGISFSIGGSLGLIWIWRTRGAAGLARLGGVSWKIYAFGSAGLFGYHFLYFSALRMAPPAQAGLIAYLWPLMIVLMSGLLPGEHLRRGHVLGAMISFTGAVVLIANGSISLQSAALPGYGLAFLCALTWSGYSVLSRRLGDTPTDSVAVFCIVTALLSFAAHLALEETVWPITTTGWLSTIALGLGPVGLAFYLWDIGVKKGDIQMLGVASYAAPLLSTLVLIIAGVAQASGALLLAAVFITCGAAIAARASSTSD